MAPTRSRATAPSGTARAVARTTAARTARRTRVRTRRTLTSSSHSPQCARPRLPTGVSRFVGPLRPSNHGPDGQRTPRPARRSAMPRRLIRALALAAAALTLAVGTASAHPDNANTLHFELTCDDGNVWQASFNGGPSAFHLDGGGLYIWKEIAFVTPTGESGVI